MKRSRGASWLALALLLLVAVAVSACAQTSRRVPQPLLEVALAQTFSSPLAAPDAYRVYLPMVYPAQNKLGMAGCPASCDEFGCSWCYSWSLQPGSETGRESVPMLWDETGLLAKVGGNSGWLMGWNEPDICPSQACISPDEGAILWRIVEMRNPGRLLLSPAPSHLRPEWLAEWREAYRALWGAWPRIDGLAAHCYLQSADGCIALVQRFEEWAREWGEDGKPLEVWVTEFAFLPAYCDAPTEARRFTAYLDESELVTRWAPYVSYAGDLADPTQCPSEFWADCRPEADPSLLRKDLQTLTPLGRVYARPPDEVWWGQGW